MEHVSQAFAPERSKHVGPSDIEAAARAIVGTLFPDIPASHRGAWHYDPRTGKLGVRVTHSAIAVTLQLHIPAIQRALVADFPGRVKSIMVRIGPPQHFTD